MDQGERPLLEINDGVRRAKAADLTGLRSIRATVDAGGPAREVPISDLRVPRGNRAKHAIDITSEWAEERWLDTYVRTAKREVPPPIDVRTAPNSDGVPIRDVRVTKRGRPVDPLTGEATP